MSHLRWSVFAWVAWLLTFTTFDLGTSYMPHDYCFTDVDKLNPSSIEIWYQMTRHFLILYVTEAICSVPKKYKSIPNLSLCISPHIRFHVQCDWLVWFSCLHLFNFSLYIHVCSLLVCRSVVCLLYSLCIDY